MNEQIIAKDSTTIKNSNIKNYNKYLNHFKNHDFKEFTLGLPHQTGINIAFEAIDRHANNHRTKNLKIAKFISSQGNVKSFTYQQLKCLTNQFANILTSFDIQKEDRVFCILPRGIELFICGFGILKARAVFCPLFSSFGPEPIKERMEIGDAKFLITTKALYKKNIESIRDEISSLKHVILIDDNDANLNLKNVSWFYELMNNASDEFKIEPTDNEDMAIIHFTSGTTGTPKGAIHVHQAVSFQAASAKFALDMKKEDVYWCTADPGWVTGTSYGMIAPLVNRVPFIVYEGEFSSLQWLSILKKHKVTNWYTAPTALRMLMQSDYSLKLDTSSLSLRIISSVGEPLNPEIIRWSIERFNLPVHDNWWQTETGGIIISNYASMNIKIGSMGRPIPGLTVEIVELDGKGKVKILDIPKKTGIIAIKKDWPSMFKGYLHNAQKYRECFHSNFYLSGDLAYKDEDGYFWFVGRMDDVIKVSGHLIGPFEVESVYMEHPAVVEAAIIGVPDPLSGQKIKAFVVLNKDYSESENLKSEIMAFARKKLGSAIAPKEIEFVADLPKTRSGKIMRRLLKSNELGLSRGDTSTLLPGVYSEF